MNKENFTYIGDDIFLTSSQAAKFLNISTSTLKKFITAGKIQTIKTPGGHYRINKKTLLERLYEG